VNDDLIRGLIQGLSTIDDQTRGMVEFVNNYRKLTKLPEPVLGQIEVTGWIEKIGILITDQLQEAGVRLSFSVDPGISIIHADPRLLNQVILNLVNNAIDAMRENQGKKELSISLFRVDPEHVYIRVSNNGAPIPEEELEKIFIPFYTTKEHGSGIGLYLSRQIIHQHGGLLSVSSRSGETSFLIELPEPANEYPGHTRMSTPANPG
jgi:signal transduction histidine kinase